MSGDDTITRDELAKALAVGVMEGQITLTAVSDVVAAGLFRIALRNREPEYEPGAIYQSPDGRTWCRMRRSAADPDETPGWRCCESGTFYAHHVPARPLHRMVRGVRPSAAEIDRLIADAYGQGHGELAGRICALLDGVPS